MKKNRRLAGRFQPWRVYARWLWIVRVGLTAVPLVLLLSGGIQWYLSPPKFRSSAEIEYTGSRSQAAAAALLTSPDVVDRAVSELGLSQQLGVEKASLVRLLERDLRAEPDPAAGSISLAVRHFNKQTARDLAAALPAALEKTEQELAARAVQDRRAGEESAVMAAEEAAETARQDLARLLEVRGAAAAEGISRLDLDEARADWQHAHRTLLDARARLAATDRELAHPVRTVAVIAHPVVAQRPVTVKWKDSLGSVALRALAGGLLCALAVPYLLELAFPRRRRPVVDDEWLEEAPEWVESRT